MGGYLYLSNRFNTSFVLTYFKIKVYNAATFVSNTLKISVPLRNQFTTSEHLEGGRCSTSSRPPDLNKKQTKRRSPEGWGIFPEGEREEKEDVIQRTIRLW